MRTLLSLRYVAARLLLAATIMSAVAARAQVDHGNSLVFAALGSRLTIKPVSLPPPWTVELWVKRQNSPAVSAPLFVNSSTALKLEQFGTPRSVGFTQFGVRDYAFNYVAPAN